jgi:hypothetical protein
MPPEAEPIFEVGRGRWDEAVLERGWLMSSSPARLPASSRAKLGVDARFEHQAAIFTAFWPLAGRKHGFADSTTRLPVTKETRISRPLTCECPCARTSSELLFFDLPPGEACEPREDVPGNPLSRTSTDRSRRQALMADYVAGVAFGREANLAVLPRLRPPSAHVGKPSRKGSRKQTRACRSRTAS